jgi:hypothetical protein
LSAGASYAGDFETVKSETVEGITPKAALYVGYLF